MFERNTCGTLKDDVFLKQSKELGGIAATSPNTSSKMFLGFDVFSEVGCW